MSKYKYAMSDEQWNQIRNYIPARKNTHPRGGGRKPKDDRLVFEAILFVLRFGCQWNALDATGLCPSSTVHDRFHKWLHEGVFHQLKQAGLLDDGATKGIDWSWVGPVEELTEAAAPVPTRLGTKPGRSWQERRRKPVAPRFSETVSGVKQ